MSQKTGRVWLRYWHELHCGFAVCLRPYSRGWTILLLLHLRLLRGTYPPNLGKISQKHFSFQSRGNLPMAVVANGGKGQNGCRIPSWGFQRFPQRWPFWALQGDYGKPCKHDPVLAPCPPVWVWLASRTKASTGLEFLLVKKSLMSHHTSETPWSLRGNQKAEGSYTRRKDTQLGFVLVYTP